MFELLHSVHIINLTWWDSTVKKQLQIWCSETILRTSRFKICLKARDQAENSAIVLTGALLPDKIRSRESQVHKLGFEF